MAITNGYATLDELKARLDITDGKDDTKLEHMLEAASRQIDGLTGRTFYVETTARVVSADETGALTLDRDIHAITAIATDNDGDRVYETEWSATDWETIGSAPYQAIYRTPFGGRAFPAGNNRVRVTGSWGYGPTVPHAIREATLLTAARLFKRKDAPFGVVGSAEHGQLQTISSADPDVKALIAPYRRFGMVF